VNWETIHHLADLTGLLTIGTLAWRYLTKVKEMASWIEDDHLKVTALWREHGYSDWDGRERRERDRI
jgi:hypothetical protein